MGGCAIVGQNIINIKSGGRGRISGIVASIVLLLFIMLFANIVNFQNIFTQKEDPSSVYVDFKDSRVTDHSSIDAIDKLAERYQKTGKELHLQHLSIECLKLLHSAKDLVDINITKDPKYHIADDKLV